MVVSCRPSQSSPSGPGIRWLAHWSRLRQGRDGQAHDRRVLRRGRTGACDLCARTPIGQSKLGGSHGPSRRRGGWRERKALRVVRQTPRGGRCTTEERIELLACSAGLLPHWWGVIYNAVGVLGGRTFLQDRAFPRFPKEGIPARGCLRQRIEPRPLESRRKRRYTVHVFSIPGVGRLRRWLLPRKSKGV